MKIIGSFFVPGNAGAGLRGTMGFAAIAVLFMFVAPASAQFTPRHILAPDSVAQQFTFVAADTIGTTACIRGAMRNDTLFMLGLATVGQCGQSHVGTAVRVAGCRPTPDMNVAFTASIDIIRVHICAANRMFSLVKIQPAAPPARVPGRFSMNGGG